jgi:hypothetical protein
VLAVVTASAYGAYLAFSLLAAAAAAWGAFNRAS